MVGQIRWRWIVQPVQTNRDIFEWGRIYKHSNISSEVLRIFRGLLCRILRSKNIDNGTIFNRRKTENPYFTFTFSFPSLNFFSCCYVKRNIIHIYFINLFIRACTLVYTIEFIHKICFGSEVVNLI